ncbi:MAG: hypothetical protein HFP77_04925 [Methylococcales symbiont of Iophon sp. n. MRB-2018]|nr:MAG: hypothetical protein HFP77_04925 [Methylococcales symbiont of Iophon sp. n. MRB-2018]KAF3979955.1 MAG: hypothetical protein HFP76_04455 [Methylococcales symbiont of Iophon sp. n. MRB-2018]
MNNYYKTTIDSAIKQARALTENLKSQDSTHHSTLNPISISGELPRSLTNHNNLVSLFQSEFKTKITVTHVQHSSFIKAIIMRYDDRSEIYVTSNNFCWKRFYICKELSQMLIYEEENATNTVEDVEELLPHLINNLSSESNAKISADLAAYFPAIEFLLPHSIVPDLLRLQKKGFSNNLIAKKMLVPESIVDFRLSIAGCDLFNSI